MLLLWGVLVCASAWTSLYYVIKNIFKLESEWACRLLTACHATIVTTLGGFSCYYGPWPFTDPGGPNTLMQITTLIICLGYFLFDFIWCIYHQTEGVTMLIHHAVSIYAISRILMKGVSGTEAVAGIAGLEMTNPFLQLRWFLRSLGYKDTLAFVIVEISFMLMFFFMRILGGGYLFYKIILHPKPDCESKALAGAFYVISWFFMIYITQYFYAKYCCKSRLKENEKEAKKVT
ncbi:hypothetical protein R5R35_005668 [Gryllus longicercus]|uniref:TLC domain-containing protein n=1 Tax=Gryllus longicercus TaxID=2509291 RepID=A0AAN9VL97_9ORTH